METEQTAEMKLGSIRVKEEREKLERDSVYWGGWDGEGYG